MLLASLEPSSLAEWIEIAVQVGGLLGAWLIWMFSRRCRIHVTLHFGGRRFSSDTLAGGTVTLDGSGALVVENVGSRIGRAVRLSAEPPLLLAQRPRGPDSSEDEEPVFVELDGWELGDMSPTQRYEFNLEFTDEAIERLVGSKLTVGRKRKFIGDHSTTIRIGGPGLRDVSLADTTSPAGMVATILGRIESSVRRISNRR